MLASPSVRAAGFTVLTAFPQTDGLINAIAVDSANGVVYIGGSFTTVGGNSRSNLAAINASTGAVLPWNPGTDDIVRALLVSGSTIYVGGDFAVAGGQLRRSLAAIDTTSGAPTAWNPNPDGDIYALATDGTFVYVAGSFDHIGGQAYKALAKVALNDGTAQAGWNPNPTVFSVGVGADVSIAPLGLVVAGAKLYARGIFDKIGGQTRYGLAALNLADGTVTAWNPSPDASQLVYALEVNGANVYLGGSFGTMGGQARTDVAAVTVADGTATSWAPAVDGIVQAFAFDGSGVYLSGGFTTVNGQAREHLAVLDAGTGDVWDWNPGTNNSPSVLGVLPGSTIFVGGANFTTVGGVPRANFAAVTENAIPAPAAPVLTVNGKKKITTTKAKVKIKGTATVARSTITSVEYKAGKGAYKKAAGTTAWSFTAKLKPGKNTVLVRAQAANGLTSAPSKIVVTRK